MLRRCHTHISRLLFINIKKLAICIYTQLCVVSLSELICYNILSVILRYSILTRMNLIILKI